MPGKRELTKENSAAAAAKSAQAGWLFPSVIGAALVSIYAGFCIAAGAADAIAPHTFIGGEDVGGLTRTEVVWAVDSVLDDLRYNCGVHALLDDGTEAAYLSYDELGLTFDADALAEDAYASSHSGNPFTDGWQLLTATLGRSTAVTPVPNPGWEDGAAQKLAEATQIVPEDFSYEVLSDDILRLTKQTNGRDADRDALSARLRDAEADETGSRTVNLPYTVTSGKAGDLAAIDALLGGSSANAKYDTENGGIIPERSALHFDVAQAQQLLDAAAPGATVDIPTESFEPEITAAELEQVLFRDLLGTYTTRVGGAAGRKANVKLTAKRVNGVVLNAGDTFNYYDYCGPFTAANGYQSAPGYLHGKTVEMDGGGACQCSSTLYAAALLSNLEIVARTAHGFASDYIGLGLDATVSGGGPDFIFRNNTLYPIKIETVYSDKNRLTVNLYGTKTDDLTVKMRTEVLSSKPFEEEIVDDPTLAPGERVVEQTAYTGYTVNTYRQLYRGDELVSETFEARSKYNARNRIVRVGPTEEGATIAPESNTPAPEPEASPVTPSLEPTETESPVETPVPETPSDIPGGVDPTPISEQLERLTQPGGDV